MKISRTMGASLSLFILLLLAFFTNCSSSNPDMSGLQKSSADLSSNSTSTPTTPQSSGPAAGAACASEGVIDYDFSQHKPVYCNASKVWRLVIADVPAAPAPVNTAPVQGTWCGYTTTYMPYPSGTYLNGQAGGGTVLCQGMNPSSGCPAGYVQFSFCYESDHYNNCNNAMTCIKQ